MHAVLGGGLAGLVAARHLAESGIDVELFEAEDRVGGRVRSRVVDGHTLDRGFQVLFTAYPAVERELDLEALDVRRFAPGATIARPGRRSTLSDPLGDLSGALPTILNRDVTLGDKLRLFRLQQELRRRDVDSLLEGRDTTIREYLEAQGFSEAFIEQFAAPFYGGITLDRSLSTSSHIFEYTFKMLAEGDTVVPASGMGAIPQQLRERAESVGVTVHTDRPATALETDGKDVSVEVGSETIDPEAVVVATDPETASNLCGVDAPTAYNGCVTVHCSLPAHQALDTGSRILLNAVDDEPNTIAPMSAAAPSYAPADEQLLSATFLGSRAEDDDELTEIVRETLTDWYPEHHFGELRRLAVDRIERAQFTQPPGFRDALPAVDDPDGPVYLAGDYTRWSAIQGAMASGRRAAAAALED
ncbi:MAG: NAD(P)/FAD-dependent oxidoreductase [Natronomonas sp.]